MFKYEEHDWSRKRTAQIRSSSCPIYPSGFVTSLLTKVYLISVSFAPNISDNALVIMSDPDAAQNRQLKCGVWVDAQGRDVGILPGKEFRPKRLYIPKIDFLDGGSGNSGQIVSVRLFVTGGSILFMS